MPVLFKVSFFLTFNLFFWSVRQPGLGTSAQLGKRGLLPCGFVTFTALQCTRRAQMAATLTVLSCSHGQNLRFIPGVYFLSAQLAQAYFNDMLSSFFLGQQFPRLCGLLLSLETHMQRPHLWTASGSLRCQLGRL